MSMAFTNQAGLVTIIGAEAGMGAICCSPRAVAHARGTFLWWDHPLKGSRTGFRYDPTARHVATPLTPKKNHQRQPYKAQHALPGYHGLEYW